MGHHHRMPRAIADQRPRIKFDIAVKEGKQIMTLVRTKQDQWRLGELADRIEPKYGDQTLQKFAGAINCEYVLLKDYRTTFQAWPEKAGRPAFQIARALNPHPQRFRIVNNEPNLTLRQARHKMKMWRMEHRQPRTQTPAMLAKKAIKVFNNTFTTNGELQLIMNTIQRVELEQHVQIGLSEALAKLIRRLQKTLDKFIDRPAGTIIDLTARRL
jgi:hypothetical protein